MIIYAPVSLGELIDKITILQIKKEKMSGDKLRNVEKELNYLNKICNELDIQIELRFYAELKIINITLWEIEDQIRLKENKQEFDNEFIELARSIYRQNDKRASIKKEINYQYSSNLIEEKYYSNFN
tara:strand:+ start:1033 stop:1413 length:381 start_codon:yes stop_codon:yes gene_type:complete